MSRSGERPEKLAPPPWEDGGPLGHVASPQEAVMAFKEQAQRLAVVRVFCSALVIAAGLGTATFLYYWYVTPAGQETVPRGTLLLVALFALGLTLTALLSRHLSRDGRLPAATYMAAFALIAVGTADLVLIAEFQAVATLIYCVAIGIAALGLEARQWPWLTAVIGAAAALGSYLQYYPIVAQVHLPHGFLTLVTVLATTWGLCFPMGLFWMFSSSLTTSQTRAWQLAQSLAHAHHLKSEFLDTMSHELRSPLHVIIGNAQMLREGASGAWTGEQVHLLERISKYAVELLRLVQSTLDLSRLENGRMPMHIERFAMRDVLAEVEEAIKPLPKPDGLVLRWQVASDVPDLVTDRLKVKEIVQNLVTNAVKFTPHGWIEICVTRAGDDALVVVRDTGIGIPADDLSLIFESFRQSSESIDGRFGGVGLGLYIVKRLVELLGGSIEVDSARGAGTTFRARVPLYHQRREAVPSRDSRRQPDGDGQRYRSSGALAGDL